ncbi:hypothetical protein NEDG_00928 [Nematocida displodere]|uniref:GOLD domain-containing protein n=1 Tax=Nematocida displodere TaxID=1805483 RepID=A0A177ECR7_9MICR|nr:hypothetical protein NEDG_00928 [Nematocida displodere]
MKRLVLFIAAAVALASCELFHVSENTTLNVGLRITTLATTKLQVKIVGDPRHSCSVTIKDPHGELLRKFEDDSDVSYSFIPKTTGDYMLAFVNPLADKAVDFSLDLPLSNEGPFASSASEADLAYELEEELRLITLDQKTILDRQTSHLALARNTKAWIKKLTVLELCLCFYALYYVHGEAVKTFYGTRKV